MLVNSSGHGNAPRFAPNTNYLGIESAAADERRVNSEMSDNEKQKLHSKLPCCTH
jgi:hypothetical protein